MKKLAFLAVGVAAVAVTAALAQTDTAPAAQPAAPAATAPAAPATPAPDAAAPADAMAAPVSAPIAPPKDAVLQIKALDKITGKAIVLAARLNKPVKFATLTITARTCYSTPPSETPETSAFLQIDDDRPDQSHTRAFSGWMYASSPGLNSLQHPLYDVWVISCASGQVPTAVAQAPVKVVSPNAGANEAMPTLPEDAGQ
ncbi:DUF2155 domain-containing protein [Rhizomicrobium electricum]|uniref:DUF2155 domain-containing protein n=1 Tax=Rhizomicrobium electricum TaxID=480070 RepID=A0ABP3P4K1_9PROT|nr:DUF2155 domain-containing protein [Rhizomicrobium electricum]NIJ47673.1 hypothetical protein [Rhizomicrobium electricum]